ncbi:anti-sigma factor family protein [Streptomyces colonosanans]|uniref:Zinc-finger domain-containing protein n=1 Tax=Streptomyces colonosanans TaxID=1428652 RepID=A0A1S2PEB6_9ACTN|nr:hypothetical protein [Streptomyces colonosanans]OIJ91946.1 hypothetical protein BIV24_14340 [Streptomyces colonosanans]
MTATTDTAGHPEVEELSDLSEGLLPPSRTADVQQHLDTCVLCADVYNSLEQVRDLLGTLADPPRMSDDVAERIDVALAAEAFLDASAPDAATADVSSVTYSAEPAIAHVSRETSPPSPSDRPSGHARATTGPGRTNRTRRAGRRTVALGTAFTAAALGLGTLLVQALGDDAGTAPTATRQHTDAAHTYSEGTLQSQVANLLATSKTSQGRSGSAKPWGIESDSGTTGSTEQQNTTSQDTPAPVPNCIEQGIHSNETVLAADKGVYRGTAVYLVVTPDASDTSKVTAYIVDAACLKNASASPGKVLLTHSYARS